MSEEQQLRLTLNTGLGLEMEYFLLIFLRRLIVLDRLG